MNNSKKGPTGGKHGSIRSDDQSAISTVDSATASVLDERIKEQRKGYNNGSTSADREAKELARKMPNKSGFYRDPVIKGNARQPSSRPGSIKEVASEVSSIPPRNPSHGSSTIINGNVRAALEKLEKDVIATMPHTSPRFRTSSKSFQQKDNQCPGQLELREKELAPKGHGNLLASDASVSRRTAPSNLSKLEADMVAKTQVRAVASNGAVVKRLNRMEADLEAKSRARASPSSTAPKRMNQIEADLAAKNKIRSSPSSGGVSKRLNKLEDDVAAKAQARASRNSITVAAVAMSNEDGGMAIAHMHALQNAEDELLMTKNASCPAVVSANGLDSRVFMKLAASQVLDGSRATTRPGAISSLSNDHEERIAFKTGIPLSPSQLSEDPEGTTNKNSNVESFSKMPETGKDLHVVHKRPECAVVRKEFHWDMDSNDEDDDEEGNRLAVAVAVKDYEDEDVFIPSAVEYDPDAKPPIYKNRRFRMYGILVCISFILVLGCAIGILAVQEENHSVPTQVFPTGAPTCERCGLGIEEQLELEVGSEKLYDPSTAEYLAKEWIIFEDSLQLLPMDANLVQRFLLAAFYFETHKSGEWLSCNHQGEDNPDETCDYQRIVTIYPLTYEAVPGIRWLSSSHECNWAGLQCDELNQTRVVDLPGQNISGTFPAVLTRLPYVQTLTLAWNNFKGPLPDSIGNMKHLLNFEVQYNQFTGNIPKTWSNAKNLQLVNFGGNLLSGQMPTEVGYLRNLKGMFLYENALTGSFPDEFAKVSLLTYARFQKNMMSGTLPAMLADMRLNEFWIQHNPVQGTIPSELGKLSNHLFDLRFYATEMQGTIPEEIYDLTSLWRFDLHTSNFSGTISSKIGNLTSLSVFRINDNRFTGTLPTELESLSSLKTLNFGFNRFSGSVPIGLCDMKGPVGTLEFLEADCHPDPISGLPMVTCECCDSCCSPNIDECTFDDGK